MVWRNLQFFDENMGFPIVCPRCPGHWLPQPIKVQLTTSQAIISHDTSIGHLGSSVCIAFVPFFGASTAEQPVTMLK